jgi:hypothetical protein
VFQRAGQDIEHVEVKLFELALTEKAKMVRDGCVRILRFREERQG